jgi:hypothetical protein
MMERRREPFPGALRVLFGARTWQREAVPHSLVMRPGSTVYREWFSFVSCHPPGLLGRKIRLTVVLLGYCNEVVFEKRCAVSFPSRYVPRTSDFCLNLSNDLTVSSAGCVPEQNLFRKSKSIKTSPFFWKFIGQPSIHRNRIRSYVRIGTSCNFGDGSGRAETHMGGILLRARVI